MPLNGIDNVFTGRGSQGLLVGILDSRKGAVSRVPVAGDAGSIVWTLVVVATNARLIETVDDVGALEVLFPKVWSTVSNLLIMTQLVEWAVRLVAWVACFEGASSGEFSLVERRGRRVAGSPWLALVHGSEGFGAVVVGEPGTFGAGRAGRGWVVIPPALRRSVPMLRH